jgi:mycothiol synthase
MRTDAGAGAAASAPPFPDLALRTYRHGDDDAIAALWNRAAEHDGVPRRTDAAELANWFGSPNDKFDPARDLFLVERDGQVVATADVEWVDTTDDLREFRVGCSVDPALRGQGIGTWLQHHIEGHAAALAALYPSQTPVGFGSWAAETETGKVALLGRFGFAPARSFYDMVRPTLDGVDEPSVPQGLRLAGIRDDQLKQLWNADIEAFRDHWGGFDDSDENYQRWRGDPKFDPSLFVIAWDGDQIAGGVINEISETENAAFNRRRGWLRSVFVRRPWRRRGLGLAVVLRSLHLLRERGMTSAGLGVDADNPTGAVGVYERAGFEVELRFTAYRKPME